MTSKSHPGFEASILLLDDDAVFRKSAEIALRKGNYQILPAENPDSAFNILKSLKIDLAICSADLNNVSPKKLTARLKALDPEIELIIVTAGESVRDAIDAVRQGAYNCIARPFKDEELLLQIEKALEHSRLKKELAALREEITWKYSFDSLPGVSEAATRLRTTASKVAGTDIPVLITGEPGTGKETLARTIHHHSHRRKGRFISIKCAVVPVIREELLEQANGGTVFLDEVGNLPVNFQEKILHILKKPEIIPAGSSASKRAEVRIIASSSKHLKLLAKEGKFREDLFRRLNVMPVHIPPLRERAEDILPLVEHFIRMANSGADESKVSITPEAMEKLIAYSWPGNIRELENTINRAIGLAGKNIIGAKEILFISSDRSLFPSEGGNSIGNKETGTLEESLKQRIEKALYANDWNLTRTAVNLGIGRTTLWRKIKKHNIRKEVVSGC